MVDVSSHNLIALLATRARRHPQAVAFVTSRRGRDTSMTYGQFWERIGRVATALAAQGIGPGDRILLMQGVSPDLYVTLSAAWRLGAVACLIDPGVGLRRFERMAARTDAVGMIGPRPVLWLRWLSPTLRRLAVAASVEQLSRAGTNRPILPIIDVDDGHPALLTFTSGSTGEPKAIVRSHGLLAAQLAALREAIALEPGERDLLTLPVFALANLACGLTTVIADANLRHVGRVDPAALLTQIERCGVTRCTASPAFFGRLLDHTEASCSSLPLRKAYTGGAPVFLELLDRLARAMPKDATVSAIYGSTEAEPIAEVDRREMTDVDRERTRAGGGLLAGRVSPFVRLRVIATPTPSITSPVEPAAFEALTRRANEPGEIVVCGDHVVRGYLDGIGDETTKMRVGSAVWHRTGDLGYLDTSDRLWLLGRPDGAASDGRGTVYALAVEAAAMAKPGVTRVAFLGFFDRRVLVVEPRPGADVGKLLADLRLPPALTVDETFVVRRIPVDRRHNAKVDYPALRSLLSRRLGNKARD